jgi:hypothetical protein
MLRSECVIDMAVMTQLRKTWLDTQNMCVGVVDCIVILLLVRCQYCIFVSDFGCPPLISKFATGVSCLMMAEQEPKQMQPDNRKDCNADASVVLGYKIFDSDWKCRDYQYPFVKETSDVSEPKPPHTAVHDGPVKMCESGFHFCQRALDCIDYYDLLADYKYAQVAASKVVITDGNKSVTNRLTLVKELSFEEFTRLCTGIVTTWWANGFKCSETTYRNGEMHGVRRFYHENGSKRLEGTFNNGYICGTYTCWDDDGRVVAQSDDDDDD